MIYRSCSYPASCDCADCEGMNSKKWKNNMKILGKDVPMNYKKSRKPLNRNSRMLSIKNYYNDIGVEYHEQNIPTNLYELFSEFLTNIPDDHFVDVNVIGLFQSALNDRTNTKKQITDTTIDFQ